MYKKYLKIVAISIGVLLLIVIGAISVLYYRVNKGYYGAIPTEEELKNIRNQEASEVYTADSVLIGRYYFENRSNVAFEKIPVYLTQALLATEDVRFYTHDGVDETSTLRVLIKSILLGDKKAGGGSTISQQLAKNLFGRKSFGKLSMPINKLREIIIAKRIEKAYSKDEILQMYLNTVSFGENTYGIQTASELFFSKPVSQLKVEQSATLVGLLKSPTLYNPRTKPLNAVERRNTVLKQMEKYEYITTAQYDSISQIPIRIKYSPFTTSKGLAPYFREKLRLEMVAWVNTYNKKNGTNYNLYTDGLKIYTTLDSKAQKLAEDAVALHLAYLQKELRRQSHGRAYVPNQNKMLVQLYKRTDRYKGLKSSGASEQEIKNDMTEKIPMKLWDWKGEFDTTMSPLDSLKYYFDFLNAGFMAMDASTGAVIAWVGGVNHNYFKYDHVTSKRQVGSTFKPFVYLTALEKGRNPCDMIKNEQVPNKEYNDWNPTNADGKYGGYYSMKGALANSVNTISAKLIMETGVVPVISTARRMGITGTIPAIPSISLGTVDVSLEEMVTAYGAFANGGVYKEPYYLQKITTADGKLVYAVNRRKLKQKRVVEKSYADMITEMLQHVINTGTAARLRGTYGIRGAVAGKTGTTQNASDGWFIAYTPGLVAGCWVGGEYPFIRFRGGDIAQGSRMAMPVWAYFVKGLQGNKKYARYLNTKFNTSVGITMDCVDYKEETLMDKLFNSSERKTKREARREERRRRREMRKTK